MRSRKKLVVAIAAALVLATSVFLWISASNREPPFIHELGARMNEDLYLTRHRQRITMRTYTFKARYETVVRFMRRDLKTPEWAWSESTVVEVLDPSSKEKPKRWDGWTVSRGAEWFSIYKDYPPQEDGEVEVTWDRDHSWFQEQWATFKKWIDERSKGSEP